MPYGEGLDPQLQHDFEQIRDRNVRLLELLKEARGELESHYQASSSGRALVVGDLNRRIDAVLKQNTEKPNES